MPFTFVASAPSPPSRSRRRFDPRVIDHPTRHCPACRLEMLPQTFAGSEVDRCPDCGGIWVEGGALDGFLARRELASWRPYHHADGRDPATRRRGRREQGFQLRLLGGGHVS